MLGDPMAYPTPDPTQIPTLVELNSPMSSEVLLIALALVVFLLAVLAVQTFRR